MCEVVVLIGVFNSALDWTQTALDNISLNQITGSCVCFPVKPSYYTVFLGEECYWNNWINRKLIFLFTAVAFDTICNMLAVTSNNILKCFHRKVLLPRAILLITWLCISKEKHIFKVTFTIKAAYILLKIQPSFVFIKSIVLL